MDKEAFQEKQKEKKVEEPGANKKKENGQTPETLVEENVQHNLEKRKSLNEKVASSDHLEKEIFWELIEALERFKVIMTIREMFKQSPCYIQLISSGNP
jgi:hypothetical protein